MSDLLTRCHAGLLGLAAAAVLLLAPPLGAQPEPITLEQAVVRALAGTGFESARLTFEKARLDYQQALATNAASPSPFAERVARHKLRQAENELVDSHFDTVGAVVGAYLDVLSARAGLQVAELQVQRARASRDVARQKARSGAIGPVELQDAEQQLRSAESDRSRAEVALMSAVHRLVQLLGYPEPAPGPEALRLPDPLPALPELSEAEAVERALAASRDLAWRREAVEIARQELEQATAEQASELTLRLRDNALRQAELAARQAALALRQSVLAAHGQLRASWTAVAVARARLELERERLQGLRQQRELGLKTELDVLAGEIAAVRAEQEYVGAVKGYLTARIDFNRLVGEPPGFGPASVLDAAAGEPGAPPAGGGAASTAPKGQPSAP